MRPVSRRFISIIDSFCIYSKLDLLVSLRGQMCNLFIRSYRTSTYSTEQPKETRTQNEMYLQDFKWYFLISFQS